jgi:hypothetical protein
MVGMIEPRCLTTCSMMAEDRFRSSSPIAENDCYAGKICFVRNPPKKSVHPAVSGTTNTVHIVGIWRAR